MLQTKGTRRKYAQNSHGSSERRWAVTERLGTGQVSPHTWSHRLATAWELVTLTGQMSDPIPA